MKVVIAVITVVISMVGTEQILKAEELSIYDIQYTTDPNGASPLDGNIVDCLGGIVTHKPPTGRPRLVIQDPDYALGWGAIQAKDLFSTGVFDDVNVGDWVSFTNVLVEENVGNTFLQYMADNDPNFRIISTGNLLPSPLTVAAEDILAPVEEKRYMHHYNFPPFSTGETRMLRGSSRREIGHGALAERALLPVIPPQEEFPYTMRLVSEVLSSNGSTSMASVCGSTLALMDTGVPIKAPVAGIAMGLVKEQDRYAVLTDIQGLEDHLGDMDFKVAGTREGITALQMDIKIKGITSEMMAEALDQAKNARLKILDAIETSMPRPRAELKEHAPRLTVLKVDPEKIGAIIGPGGKVIRSIQDETGVRIDIEDDGTVYIGAVDGESAKLARERIESLVEEPVVGRIYTGKVVRTTDFGAFVEILPNTDGLVHISQLASERIEKVEDVAVVGDEITVMVTAIDSEGKIRLSRQAVLEGWTAEEAIEHDRPRKRHSGGPSGRRSRDRSDRNKGYGSRNRDRR